jgi:flagellar hook-basal body complex protein FliE
MSEIAALQALQPLPELPADLAAPPSAAVHAASSFGQLFVQGLEQVNRQLMTSQVDLQQLAAGDAQNLHEIMIRLEESRLGFQVLMQVRGRLLEAYQDIMKMQV